MNWAGWGMEEFRFSFFKCTRWQLEETLDKFSCPFHYYCDSIYPGDYPPAVDFLLLIFTAATYSSTLFIMLADLSSRGQILTHHSKRWLLPSGPIALPLFLFALAKGHRINAIFPLFLLGPPILHLVYISALTFDNNGAEKDIIKNVFFEASTMSGILHASLNLDSVILPYYTGLDALVGSRLSGECPSCVCRNDPLVVGGRFVSYRGWSGTTFVVVCAVCVRMFGRLSEVKAARKMAVVIFKAFLEGLAWVLITWDCFYLITNPTLERTVLEGAVYAAIFALVFVHLVKVVRRWQLMSFGGTELEIKV